MAGADFIEVYEDALPAAACRALVDRFEASNAKSRGRTGGGVDTALKDSWDIRLDAHAEWRDARDQLNQAALAGLMRYLRRYGHVALAPLHMKVQPPGGGAPVTLDAERLAAIDEPTLKTIVAKVFRPGGINMQKYFADVGGYPYWHSEQYPAPDQGEALHRALLWTIYLNDGFAEGETEFLYQQRKVVPKTGALLIAPAGFTHTHRGNRPRGGDKYIATSWVMYQRAEALFGAAPAR